MGKHHGNRVNGRTPAPRRRWRGWAMVAVAVVLVGAAGGWILWAPPEAAGGTPRLVLDRDTVDLGSVPFETPARVVFTLTNEGDGALTILNTPRVEAVEGC